MDYAGLLFPEPNPLQAYCLVFLAGTLTVSSLSDLRRLAAQADFAEVWGAYAAAMFLADAYLGLSGQLGLLPFVMKWVLVAAATAASSKAGNLSLMDSAALAALMSTLAPGYVILAALLTLIANELMKPLLASHGEGGAYPFLPTVLLVNAAMLAILASGGLEPYLTASS